MRSGVASAMIASLHRTKGDSVRLICSSFCKIRTFFAGNIFGRDVCRENRRGAPSKPATPPKTRVRMRVRWVCVLVERKTEEQAGEEGIMFKTVREGERVSQHIVYHHQL